MTNEPEPLNEQMKPPVEIRGGDRDEDFMNVPLFSVEEIERVEPGSVRATRDEEDE